jgi:hypothetical protein
VESGEWFGGGGYDVMHDTQWNLVEFYLSFIEIIILCFIPEAVDASRGELYYAMASGSGYLIS